MEANGKPRDQNTTPPTARHKPPAARRPKPTLENPSGKTCRGWTVFSMSSWRKARVLCWKVLDAKLTISCEMSTPVTCSTRGSRGMSRFLVTSPGVEVIRYLLNEVIIKEGAEGLWLWGNTCLCWQWEGVLAGVLVLSKEMGLYIYVWVHVWFSFSASANAPVFNMCTLMEIMCSYYGDKRQRWNSFAFDFKADSKVTLVAFQV